MNTPPKVSVYHITDQIIVIPPSKSTRRFFVPIFVITLLVMGAVGGGFAVWESKFGQADREEPASTVPISASGQQKSIPISFDQSELNVVADLLPLLIQENRREPSPEELRNKERKDKLRAYLAKWKSPLAKEEGALDALLVARNMRMVIAISHVESNMCKKHLYHNCSGIGGSSAFRKYPNFAGWVKDMDSLLERRYKNLPVEKFIGVYVQPGSQNWVDGVKQILAELKRGGIE
jgi:hypothetical protein